MSDLVCESCAKGRHDLCDEEDQRVPHHCDCKHMPDLETWHPYDEAGVTICACPDGEHSSVWWVADVYDLCAGSVAKARDLRAAIIADHESAREVADLRARVEALKNYMCPEHDNHPFTDERERVHITPVNHKYVCSWNIALTATRTREEKVCKRCSVKLRSAHLFPCAFKEVSAHEHEWD